MFINLAIKHVNCLNDVSGFCLGDADINAEVKWGGWV